EHETETVTAPLVMIGARCAMPVQPVSRMLAGSVASPVKVMMVGQSHVHERLHVKPGPAFGHCDPGGSQNSPASTVLLPQSSPLPGVLVGTGVGDSPPPVAVSSGVALALGVATPPSVGVAVSPPAGVAVSTGVAVASPGVAVPSAVVA